MKLTKNIFIIALFALISTGCEDFLEPNSKSEFVPKDATSLNELLLGEAYQRNDKDGLSVFMCLLDDDIEATPYQKPNAGFDENKYLALLDRNESELMPKLGGVLYNGVAEGIKLLSSRYKLFMVSNCGADGLKNFLK